MTRAPAAFFSIGTDGCIRLVNQRAACFLGYQVTKLTGRHVLDLYADSPSGKIQAHQIFQRFCAGTEISGQTIEMRRADGSSLWASLTVQPIRDAEGRISASCSMVQEIKENQPSSFNEVRPVSRVLVKSSGSVAFMKEKEIDWFEAAGNYVELHAGAKSYLLRRTMNDIETKLDPDRFLRIHRSAIVNVDRIKELRSWFWGDYHVILQNGTQLTMSRSYRKKLRARLVELS